MMRHLIITIGLFCLFACAPHRPAKVDEIGTKPHRSYVKSNTRHNKNNKQNLTHKVVKGDSLYSIGFRYHKDYKTLASINNIKPPYRIYPNQIIRLTGETKDAVFKPTNNAKVKTQPIITQKPIVAKNEPLPKTNTKTQTSDTLKSNKSTTISKPVVAESTTTNPKPISKPPAQKPITVQTPNKIDLKWLWPTKGKIRTTFLASNPARKGISISGLAGQPIKAAEAGVVVYSGNGLLGYGELIIIKHNDAFLSAYGHNKSLKVREGQTVTRGQVIAELGSSGTNINNLHFEIRKNGKPVNPLNYVKP